MKTTCPSAEIKAIANLCSGSKDVKTYLMGSLKEDHFGVPAAQEVYLRVSSLVKMGKEIPGVPILLEDPVLSQDAKDLIRNYKKSGCIKSPDSAKPLICQLDDYRKIRICYVCGEQTLKMLQEKSINIDQVIDLYERSALNARANTDMDRELLHIGVDCNADQLVKNIIEGRITSYIPTGFKSFDRINGGFRKGALISIAATTSGGKSAMAVQLLINMYRQGYNVALVSLEMDHEEVVARILSNICKIDSLDILLGRLSPKQQEYAMRCWQEFVQIGRKRNCRYSIYTPADDLSIQDVCFRLTRFGYAVLIVDYVSLLDVRGEEAWKALGETARFTKRFIKKMNMVGALLCQLSEENKVKYSRAIVEHSDNVWTWQYNEEIAQETGHIITVDQQKARSQQRFSFRVNERFNYMTLTDYEGEESNDDGSIVPNNEATMTEEFKIEEDLEY